MTDQFNPVAAEQAKQEALDHVRQGTPEMWRLWISEQLFELARRRPELTTDALWFLSDRDWGDRPPEARAMGPIMLAAERKGWIEGTERTIKSIRRDCHARPIRVWKSRLYEASS